MNEKLNEQARRRDTFQGDEPTPKLAPSRFDFTRIEPIDSVGDLPTRVNVLKFSDDGSMLFAAGGDTDVPNGWGWIRGWKVSGMEQVESFDPGVGVVFYLEISRDNRMLAAAGDQTIVWDLTKGRSRGVIQGFGSNGLAFSADGKSLFSLDSAIASAPEWNLARMQPVVRPLGSPYFRPDGPGESSEDGRWLVGYGLIHDLQARETIGKVDGLHNNPRFAPDGSFILSGGSGVLRKTPFDPLTGRAGATHDITAPMSEAFDVMRDPSQDTLVITTTKTKLHLIDYRRERLVGDIETGDMVEMIATSPRDGYLATVSYERDLRLWKAPLAAE